MKPSSHPPPANWEGHPAVTDSGAEDACNIVVAVGDVAMGRLVLEALRALDERVTLVSSATEALRAVDVMHPSILVIDDELPLVRGLDLAGKVRSERPYVDVILITDDDFVGAVIARLRVERIRCLSKPIDLDRLRQTVSSSLLAVSERRPRSTYDDLVAELELQKASFERRLKKLERERRSAAEDEARPTVPPKPSLDEAASNTTESPMAMASALDEHSPLPDDLRVLVVDDDPLVRRAMARRLSKQQVTLAANGRDATRELERSVPDVIVSDLRMPEMDGLALAEEVRRRWPELADRIVFVSGTGSHIERAEAEAPERPVLRKPVEGPQLENRIAEILEKAMLARKR